MAHTQTSPMGMVGPGSDWRWGWAPANGAWMLQNAYDCYTFSGDVANAVGSSVGIVGSENVAATAVVDDFDQGVEV